jgi:hypothetical protein
MALRAPDGTSLAGCLAALPLDEGVRREGDPLSVPDQPFTCAAI